jgi:ABC-type branched-subunit amino acid transport system substrate-binding protein
MISKRSILFSVLAALLVLSITLSACQPAEAPVEAPAAEPTQAPAAEPTQAPAEQPAEEKVFKLGVLGPFTGPSARTGDEFKQSTLMAFDAIDYKIGDYKIELVWIDEQSDPAKTSQAYEQAAVQDGVQAGVLNWHSSDAVAAINHAKYKIPHTRLRRHRSRQ